MRRYFFVIMTLDIGGTKTMWTLWQHDALIETGRYSTASIENFPELIKKLVDERPVKALCIALAGSITDDKFELTNTGQIIDLHQIRESFPDIPHISFLNDLEALAHSLLRLKEKEQLIHFREGVLKDGAKAVLSVGTGLGIAAVSREGVVLPSEGGHIDFAPCNDVQQQILLRLSEKYGHVSYERLLSGQGLSNLYEYTSGTPDVIPARITEAALAGEADARKAFDLFTEILGAACGNFALAFLATGGVYLGGGMMPKILPLIDKDIFQKSFIAKGRFDPYLKQLPVYVILDEAAPSIGAASYAKRLSSGS